MTPKEANAAARAWAEADPAGAVRTICTADTLQALQRQYVVSLRRADRRLCKPMRICIRYVRLAVLTLKRGAALASPDDAVRLGSASGGEAFDLTAGTPVLVVGGMPKLPTAGVVFAGRRLIDTLAHTAVNADGLSALARVHRLQPKPANLKRPDPILPRIRITVDAVNPARERGELLLAPDGWPGWHHSHCRRARGTERLRHRDRPRLYRRDGQEVGRLHWEESPAYDETPWQVNACTPLPRPPARKRKPGAKPAPPRAKGETERLAVRRRAAMQYRLAGASYRTIATKLTEDRANAYADANGISVERAMKQLPHVSKRTAWDDVTAELEELRRETEVQRADLMALENARLDQVFSKALSLFAKGDVPAGRLAVAVMGRRAKLNGLDAPTKIAPTDPTGEHQADTGAIDVNTLSEDTLRRVLRDEKREPLDVTRCR